MTEDEMAGWHHRLNGHEFEQTLGDSEGQGSLVFMGSERVRHGLATEQQRYMNGYINTLIDIQFSSVQSLIRGRLFATP